FAHAFYILLSPKSEFSFEKQNTNNNDPNNPWNLAPSYNQIDNDGNINSNPIIIQIPDENTNMFIDIRTSLFAIYLFLIGDSSALSNWSYAGNPSIAVLIVLFSLLIVVYLMNLLIGLLNNAIEEDNNRISYLIQKAEILAEIELFTYYHIRDVSKHGFLKYYYADIDKTRREMREKLLKELQIKHDPINNEVVLKKLSVLEGKLEKLEKLEKLLEEIHAK
ncbi:hypothetical protein RhiirC2_770419, partial [Rhizophagus irregularis]